MTTSGLSNTSSDLIWEIVRNNNCFLIKSKRNGGVQFSRDPLNLTNLHCKKHAGFVNEKAIGVVPQSKGGITVISKRAQRQNKPASALISTSYGTNKSNRKSYKSVANLAAKSGYRSDLRSAAVERVSAIRRAQLPTKPEPQLKLRGSKARKEVETS